MWSIFLSLVLERRCSWWLLCRFENHIDNFQKMSLAHVVFLIVLLWTLYRVRPIERFLCGFFLQLGFSIKYGVHFSGIPFINAWNVWNEHLLICTITLVISINFSLVISRLSLIVLILCYLRLVLNYFWGCPLR